jgi:hypothetical protein
VITLADFGRLLGDLLVASTLGFRLKTPVWATSLAGFISSVLAYIRVYEKVLAS